MNERNIDYLTERLFFLGFNENLNIALREHIQQEIEKFKLPMSILFPRATAHQAPVEYSVDFSRSKREDMYFINYYKATLKNDDDDGKQRSQIFLIDKGNGITAFEAFNLLEGRAVYKKLRSQNGEYYFQWQQLDYTRTDDDGNYLVRKYHDRYGFNLERALSVHDIKELQNPTKLIELIAKLHKGSRVPATLIMDESERQVFLEANPAHHSILVFDEVGAKLC